MFCNPKYFFEEISSFLFERYYVKKGYGDYCGSKPALYRNERNNRMRRTYT